MHDKIEKISNWYLLCLLIFLCIVTTICLLVGPLLLGLLVSPYLFLMYILTLSLEPIVILIFISIPDFYKVLIADN